MLTCELGKKKYTVDFVTGRVLREMEPAFKMYARIAGVAEAAAKGEVVEDMEKLNMKEAMDVMVHWFCLLFNNQFTPDDVYDNYPADRLMHDIVMALIAVNAQTTDILDTFPTKATETETAKV